MKSQVLHTVWYNITGEAAGEIWTWSLLGVKGSTNESCCITQVQKVHSSNLPKEKCILKVVRIGNIIIFTLNKLWRAKFSIPCYVIFLVRLQEKLKIDHYWEWKALRRNWRRCNSARGLPSSVYYISPHLIPFLIAGPRDGQLGGHLEGVAHLGER